MKKSHAWTLGKLLALFGVISFIYTFGVWSGIMWVTTNEFLAFKTAQAQIDTKQDEINARQQRRFDRDDYAYYYAKICVRFEKLSDGEIEDFEEILKRLKRNWPECK